MDGFISSDMSSWWDRLNKLTSRLGGFPGEHHLDVIERAAEELEAMDKALKNVGWINLRRSCPRRIGDNQIRSGFGPALGSETSKSNEV